MVEVRNVMESASVRECTNNKVGQIFQKKNCGSEGHVQDKIRMPDEGNVATLVRTRETEFAVLHVKNATFDILTRVTYEVGEILQERRVGVDILRRVPVGAQHDWLKLMGSASQEMCEEEINFEEDADEWQSEHREANKRKATYKTGPRGPRKEIMFEDTEVQRNSEWQFCETV